MPLVHLPSLGVFLPTVLGQHPCRSFPRNRARDYHYLGSKVLARAGAGAPTGWQHGGRCAYAKCKYWGYSCPCFTSHSPLMLCYGSQTPSWVFRFKKSFLPSSSSLACDPKTKLCLKTKPEEGTDPPVWNQAPKCM